VTLPALDVRPAVLLDRIAREVPAAAVTRGTGALADLLHRRYALTSPAAPAPDPGGACGLLLEDAGLVRRITQLLGRRFCWEDGWRLAGADGGERWLVERDGLVLSVVDDELMLTRGGVRVRFPAEPAPACPGWFAATGTAGPARGPRASAYLNGGAPARAVVFTDLLLGLDRLGVAATARVLTDSSVERPDSVVVSVARADLPVLARLALGLPGSVRAGLGAAVPGFARPLAPGVAVSDDPACGEPFLRHRCRLVAEGLVTAGPSASVRERRAAVATALAGEGLDPGALHLDPGSTDLALSMW
jgi:type III HopA1-like effector protein